MDYTNHGQQAQPGYDFTDFQAACYQIAAKSGFHDNDSADPEMGNLQLARRLLLIITEVAEAFEELRKGLPATLVYLSGGGVKPEGVPVELADVVIRVFNLAEAEGIDLTAAINTKMAYNASRERMHGKTC